MAITKKKEEEEEKDKNEIGCYVRLRLMGSCISSKSKVDSSISSGVTNFVHEREYIFKAGEGEESGIVSSKLHPILWYEGLMLRVSILIGQTTLNADQAQIAIQELGIDFPQNSYNIFTNMQQPFL